MRATLGVALLAALGLLAPALMPIGASAATVPIAFVGDSAVARNSASPWVVVPAPVQPGDRLVLVLSLNSTTPTVSSPTGVTGWSQEGNQVARSMRTVVWSKTAGVGDAGTRLDIPLSASAKSNILVAAYRGVHQGPLTVVSRAHTTTSTVRTTPEAAAPPDAWVLSYWASKSAATTTWTTPPAVTRRSAAFNTGSARIASQLADSAAPVPGPSYGNISATSDSSSPSATSWTIVMPGATSGNQPPVADFTSTCTTFECTFDARPSSDLEGPIASYAWDFGDGMVGDGPQPSHTYAAAGDYDVVLTVTDGGGATATRTRAVTVSQFPTEVVPVVAEGETDPVGHTGDAADDPAVWRHPTTPEDSLVIGNDKLGALEVYDLSGARRQRITGGTTFFGNVDVRQGVTVGAQTLDVVVAYNAGLRTFTVNPATRQLVPVGDGTGSIPTNGGEGLCAYRSAQTGELSVFVITRAGRVRQYRIHDSDGDGLLQGSLVREFEVGSESEGCLADDATGQLYVAEEDVGLWRYGAEPGAGSTRALVDAVRPTGNLAFDVEGVTMAATGPTTGYLIVSAQNGAEPSQSYFAVYDRATNAYLWSFRIVDGASADGCERTDGIAAYAGDLGPAFPQGVFVCQDNANTTPAPGNQNFKLTRLDEIIPGG